jgi:GNAT superfamily N-acetyltransferase
VLKDCVDAGASVSFLPPLDLGVARGFWQRLARDVAAGRRLLFAAWADGDLVGTVQVDLATPPNQPHRGDVAKLLVMGAVRRRGIASRLMEAAEAGARAAGRTLLVLDTWAGGEAGPLYQARGWTEVGRIPGYALLPDGSYGDTVIFYKRL